MSRAGESHPHALAELCMNLSTHTAPIIQPLAARFATGQVDYDDMKSLPFNMFRIWLLHFLATIRRPKL